MEITTTKNPNKQRIRVFHAGQRSRHAMMSAHLSKELRKTHKQRSAPLRVGDTVKIVRGDWKSRSGEITQVDYTRNKAFVKGINRKQVSGKEAFIAFRPSNLVIITLDTKDKRRFVKGKVAAPKAKATPATTAATKSAPRAGKKE